MKKRIRLTESDLHRIVNRSVKRVLRESQLLTELDPRTYANYARGRAAQGNYKKAVEGQEYAAQQFNNQYGYDNRNLNGYVQSDSNNPNVKYMGYDTDYYRMRNDKKPGYRFKWDSPDYYKNRYNNNVYATERWQSKNYPGRNDMDDQETFSTYNPDTDTSNSTTYGRMKYQTQPNRLVVYGDYDGRPIRNQNNNRSGLYGDEVARQMQTGTGIYKNGKWQ